MRTHTKETQRELTPEIALEFLKEGNGRFVNNLKANRNLLQQVNETSEGQFPFATILSCIDSRTSAELIFDQGLGDIFSIRIAGNILNEDILGSMEFGCKVAGSKLLVVLGHTKCGAIKGACDDVKLGNLTHLLEKVKPAIESETQTTENRNSSNSTFVENVADINVHLTLERVRKESPILAEMEQQGKIKVVGAMYDVESGKVTFYEEEKENNALSQAQKLEQQHS
jgi:carbonic anhydrase